MYCTHWVTKIMFWITYSSKCCFVVLLILILLEVLLFLYLNHRAAQHWFALNAMWEGLSSCQPAYLLICCSVKQRLEQSSFCRWITLFSPFSGSVWTRGGCVCLDEDEEQQRTLIYLLALFCGMDLTCSVDTEDWFGLILRDFYFSIIIFSSMQWIILSWL